MDSSRRRKCVFTDRPFIWRQKTSSMISISDVMTFYRRYFRYVVTQTITLSRCHAYLPMQWASCFELRCQMKLVPRMVTENATAKRQMGQHTKNDNDLQRNTASHVEGRLSGQSPKLTKNAGSSTLKMLHMENFCILNLVSREGNIRTSGNSKAEALHSQFESIFTTANSKIATLKLSPQ